MTRKSKFKHGNEITQMFPSLELGETKIRHLGIPVMIKLYVACFYVSMDDLWVQDPYGDWPICRSENTEINCQATYMPVVINKEWTENQTVIDSKILPFCCSQ